MSDSPEVLQRRIAELEAQLRALQAAVAPTGDAVSGDKIGSDKVAGDKVVNPQGTVSVSDDARINGVAVGVNLGTIIYGRPPIEDERRRLVWYLARLASKLYRLPVRGLEERLDQGEGLALPQVYVMLATTSETAKATLTCAWRYASPSEYEPDDEQRLEEVSAMYQEAKYHPDYALPLHAIKREDESYSHGEERTTFYWYRSLLAIEAVRQHPHLVLLGDPGGGKSTFLGHFAWALAQRGLDQLRDEMALHGWDDQRRVLPIMVSLRALAGQLATQGVRETTVYAALREAMHSYCVQQVDDLLSESLHRGAALLLLDGLDEVPITAVPDVTVDRVTTVKAIRTFAQLYGQVPIVVTCRTRAFDEGLRAELGWHAETLAPFTLGQARHFVPAWYTELVAKGQLERTQAVRLGQELIDAIVASPKLRAMAGTPLLLAMMALVIYNKGELPRDRPQLYERILDLLLGQWDKVHEGQSLAEAIGAPDWGSERIRPLLDQLSYQAHAYVTTEDGRGRLARSAVRDALIAFFETARLPEPWSAARRCLDYFEQRSGLLAPDATESYVFAHLTLQEHCAGRHIALNTDDPVALVMRHRVEDRWREPIFLGMGLVHPAVLNSLLTDLLDREENSRPKPLDRWYRDLILAAEIGQDRDWDYLRTRPIVKVDRLHRDLKRGLVELLADKNQPLPIAERVRAGFLLGDLGDPRFPVTIDDWRREIAKAQAGDTSGYFCRVEAGAYTIGSADNDPDAQDREQPQHSVTFDAPFWIARYPVACAQWRAWAQASEEASYVADNIDLQRPNQPIVGIIWRRCNEFCAWLSAQLRDALPAGAVVRLPTEFEWEAAARGGDARRYPWGNDWRDDHAAMAEDQEIRGARYSTPVGCYPAGAAPCGALDMAGNVREWTASMWQSYPGAQEPFTGKDTHVLRGGSFTDNRNRVRCGARYGGYPIGRNDGNGFRVVVAPRLAH